MSSAGATAPQPGRAVSFASVLRNSEFRAIWIADAQSALGDQIARVALMVLVWQKTGSASLTALGYALTFVPAMFGGAVLTALADRKPRRSVMVACDLIRAALVASVALPGLPTALIVAVLVSAVLAGSPFAAAESALVADVLPESHYATGIGLRSMTSQAAQLAGFPLGGVIVGLVGSRFALVLDAATYLLSAGLLAALLAQRGVPALVTAPGVKPESYREALSAGTRTVLGNRRLRVLLGLVWLVGFLVVPEGLASPYVDRVGGGPTAVGVLLAAGPTGAAVGVFLFLRYVSVGARRRCVVPLALASGLPLVLCFWGPSLAVAAALWFLAGVLSCYHVHVIAEFVRTVAGARRGHAVGMASAGLLAVQGLAILSGGVLASRVGPARAVAVAGVLSVLSASALGYGWAQTSATAADLDEITPADV
jgi:predicted MFS family arabinose efflux permease